ncbi:MAG: GNAT family N-acetyltransferase [Candidatus Heimdallarchaeota archaeon]
MVQVKKLKTAMQLQEFTNLMRINDKNVYDCSKEKYIDWVVFKLFSPNKRHIVWILYAGEKPVGYIHVRYDNGLNHELIVLSAFILPEFQGKRLLIDLLKPVAELGIKLNVNRIKWYSPEVPKEVWDRNIFGNKMKETRVYSVEKNIKPYQEK